MPVFAAPGKSLPIALNRNDPVGDGGWMTFRRSQRQSSPVLNVCRPANQVSESASSVTPVLKFDAVFGGDPSCWYPAMRNVGSVTAKFALAGMPGMPSAAAAGPGSCTALLRTARLVSPIRSSFSAL